jgi:hypothetical protein
MDIQCLRLAILFLCLMDIVLLIYADLITYLMQKEVMFSIENVRCFLNQLILVILFINILLHI